MRSGPDYIVTKSEVHGYVNHWLEKSLKLSYSGTNALAARFFKFC